MKTRLTLVVLAVLLHAPTHFLAQEKLKERQFPPKVSFHRLIPDPGDQGFVALYHDTEGQWVLEKLSPTLSSIWKKDITVEQSMGMTLSFGDFAALTSRVTTDLYPVFFNKQLFLLKVVNDQAKGKETITYSKFSPKGELLVDEQELYSGSPIGPQAFQEYEPDSYWRKNTDFSPDSSLFLFYKSEPVQRKRLPAKCEVVVFDMKSEQIAHQVIRLEHPYELEEVDGQQVQAKGIVDNEGRVYFWGKKRIKKDPVHDFSFFIHKVDTRTLEERQVDVDFGIPLVNDMAMEVGPFNQLVVLAYFGDGAGRLRGYCYKEYGAENLILLSEKQNEVEQLELRHNLSIAGMFFDEQNNLYLVADEQHPVFLNRIRFSTFPRALVSQFRPDGMLHWFALIDKRPEQSASLPLKKGLKKYKISPCQALHLYQDKLYLFFGRILDDKPTPPAQVLSFNIHNGSEIVRHSFPSTEHANRFYQEPLLAHSKGQDGIHYLLEAPGKHADPKVVQLVVIK